MNFNKFNDAVAKQFSVMSKHELYRVDVSKDDIWNTYLSSFPAGTDPIYKERTEHDCNCCKQFIRAVGDVVAIIDGKLVSIWDGKVNDDDDTYQVVSDALSKFVKSKKIANAFFHFEKTAGTKKNFQDTVDGVKTWEHFFVNIPAKYVLKDSASKMGEIRALHDVLARSLDEITVDSVDTVLELISQNSLYRGQEHKFAVEKFQKLQQEYKNLKNNERDLFVWNNCVTLPVSVSKMRNTAIGTLLVDLSDGTDMESAVKSFESKVAPANYKRPTALVTKGMIEKAKKTIEELGLTSALERRYATINDITINNIIFANRDAKTAMNGDVFSDISSSVSSKTKKLDKVQEVSIEKFISDIIPTAKSIEVMLENSHVNNLVSLIAPVDATAGNMFKWDNKFSWSYNGEFADSIKERVKKAGGSVEGDLCCRLAWHNTDDLDFHMFEPTGGLIYFGNRRQTSLCGGVLDLDANGADGMRTDPAENIFYADKRKMKPGNYTLVVNQYSKRNTSNIGFEVEIEFGGQRHNIVYDKAMQTGSNVEVAVINLSKTGELNIVKSLPMSSTPKEVWGIKTNTFQQVNVIMMSPNHWDDHGVGNKHYFFMIDGCINDGKARGFYNEFLKEELNPHRKVIEIVGSKMKTEESDQQLSGVGFSSTQGNSILCRVEGNFSRVIRVVF